jgi:hypothetical protein
MKGSKNAQIFTVIMDIYRYPLLLNLLCTGFALAWVHASKFQHTGPLFGAVAIKFVGYGLALVVERLFLNQNQTFLYNLGIGGYRVVLRMILIDFSLFAFLTFVLWMVKAYT